ncbi:hypothetical protein JCGZ_06577 [Jatropha curcas]|uniref:Uncharacterized protein n=1 Tax=Jatropha curcas TaxID=180498 RepID=A0A067LC50_JATCU|nr:hypothetical protein JCGZ_06577 [Jatropha curcas]
MENGWFNALPHAAILTIAEKVAANGPIDICNLQLMYAIGLKEVWLCTRSRLAKEHVNLGKLIHYPIYTRDVKMEQIEKCACLVTSAHLLLGMF